MDVDQPIGKGKIFVFTAKNKKKDYTYLPTKKKNAIRFWGGMDTFFL